MSVFQPVLTSDNVPVGRWIEALFNCFQDSSAFNSHYIVKALMRCFTMIDVGPLESVCVNFSDYG